MQANIRLRGSGSVGFRSSLDALLTLVGGQILFEFRRVWIETPQFIISNYSFNKFLKYGRGEDVDDFAEILMTVSVGKTVSPTLTNTNMLLQIYGSR